MINICIPTLNRYDLLRKCLLSLEAGTLKPDRYYIIDNGLKIEKQYIENIADEKIFVIKPERNLGVGMSWNWFMQNISETRIISNDDIEYYPDTLEKLVTFSDNNDGCFFFPAGIGSGNSFSLYLIKDKCRDTIGYFDPNFYPAYFEDNDYFYRMKLLGLTITPIPDCTYAHFGSATLKNYTAEQQRQHHRDFDRNKMYYNQKWGGQPGYERFTTPFGK